MDRNSAIGLTLIAALLLAYFYFFSPEPQPQTAKPAAETQAATAPSTVNSTPAPIDSALSTAIGTQAISGQETFTSLETEDLKFTFSSKGGVMHDVELKKFKTYKQAPLKLVAPDVSQFQMLSRYQGKEIDLYALFYTASQQQVGDTTIVSFSAPVGSGTITHEYRIPRKGYAFGYRIKTSGLDQQFTGDNVVFRWNDALKLKEKDLQETRNNTTITYYGSEEGFDELSPRGTTEKETFAPNQIKWVAIKEKFFLSSFISETGFAGGSVETVLNASDSSLVKRANVELFIPTKSLADGKASFKFYIGPNDYQIIGDVTEKFSKNVYLGWPPVFWINKFVIFPVFHFLTGFITNYGLIIVILVILLKLVLAPLSYRSYLSMAKMKVLKPELDEIKERVGDDMTKVQQEQMKLYQQVGVNPISGCVPVLLQMPILFAMFYLFPASIELRQEHFLWAEDLSTYDSLIQLPFALPFGVGSHISLFTLLMTASTLIYTWQNNQLSSVQGPMKSMSYIMPLIFFFVLNSFSAGLTFYYFVSNLVTFAQQAIIRKFVDDNKIKALLEENRKKIAASGGTKSKFMSKLQEAMKASEEARKKAEEERKKKKK